MHYARFEINILDFWLFGSGRGEGAHIDSTPLLDARGLPYVPGRAVKGLLRDATLDLLSLEASSESNELLTELFGTREEEGQTRHNTQPGRLQFHRCPSPSCSGRSALCRPHGHNQGPLSGPARHSH